MADWRWCDAPGRGSALPAARRQACGSTQAIPATVVASNLDEVSSRLGEDFVVKPLATGYYWNHATPHAVFTSHVRASDLQSVDFGAAPFVAQEVISAVRHLRVVTVRRHRLGGCVARTRVRRRLASQRTAAHYSWVAVEDEDVCKAAVALARRLNVGYSSQDWIWKAPACVPRSQSRGAVDVSS